MTYTPGQTEIHTQRRVIEFFQDALGYRYLGNWQGRARECGIEEDMLRDWLRRQGRDDGVIDKALRALDQAATIVGGKNLYDANREVYDLLRYGVRVQPEAGAHNVTVWLIDWQNPANNDFALAEEVTVSGENSKRPDIVLYVNGIAFGALELKRSTVSVGEGVRQNLDNQQPGAIRPFFATVQLLMAGNETEGLRYSVIDTSERYWLRWKEMDAHPQADNPLLRELGQLCRPERLLEITHDFIVFDAGVKKVCRHNQYFGVRAAQEFVRRREGGIIWHTQGSGKSLTMVWLAKWIRENVPNSRILLITDRTELDEQIEKVFRGVGESIHRTSSGEDLARVLNEGVEWLVASLIHKFGASEESDVDGFVKSMRSGLPPDFRAPGETFIFVDECHRTQSGKLHAAMKAILPNATLIGFTGTPLLKADRLSIETFGPYIHAYKYDEAVGDGVVLDLRYEARDIDQNITSPERIDQWFDAKTRGLNDVAKARLRARWGTMRRLLSSRDRLNKIVGDIGFDMEMHPRLQSGHGNAMLVCDSIYSACRIFEMFQRTDLEGKCAVITSYKPGPADIGGERTGEGATEKLLQYGIYRKMLADHFGESEDAAMGKVDQFEIEVKKRFVEEPGQMKLLIVVDKLLTGFDAPSATYLYIDKQMRDHGLFQAICRVNRLHGEGKEYGYIVDYKDLFKSLEQSIYDYTGEAFDGYDADDVQGLLKDRLKLGRERLEDAREAVKALCEPVEPPQDSAAFLRYFCGSDSDPDVLSYNEPKRLNLYRLAAALLRAYTAIANDMGVAGYSDDETQRIKEEVQRYQSVSQEINLASGDYIDLKRYEPAMRTLLDRYISASDSRKLSTFDDMTLVQLIVERGEGAIQLLPDSLRRNPAAVSETIENNVRRLIIDKNALNPRYYERMSDLLDDLIAQRKRDAFDYQIYLSRVIRLTRLVSGNLNDGGYPPKISAPALRAIFDNLPGPADTEIGDEPLAYGETPDADTREATTLSIDSAIRAVKKDGWRGDLFKEREVRNAILSELNGDHALAAELLEIVKAQSDY